MYIQDPTLASAFCEAETEKKTAEPTAQITEKERFLMLMKETSCKRNTKNM